MTGWNLVHARLGIMLLMASCLLPAAAGAREISGTVTHAVAKDSMSKLVLACGRIDEPWPELRVQTPSFLERIVWTEKATDDEGRFSFSTEADGRWIIVTRDSHYTFPRGYVVVTLGPGETPAPLDLVVCDGARREVSVFGPDGRTPLDHPENVRLVMDPTNPEIRPDTYVLKPAHELPLVRIVGKYQGDGVVVLGPAPPGYYELYSTPDDGFRFAKVDQRVDRTLEGAPLQWKEWRKRTLRCMPVPLLQAKFILPDGSPAAGAEANLLTQPNWMNGLRADADGVLRLDQDEQLPLGSVRISLPGYAGVFKPEQFSTDPTSAPWMLEPDNTPPVISAVNQARGTTKDDLEKAPQTAGQTLVVKDCQGYPLADALVTVRAIHSSQENMSTMALMSDAGGRVILPYSVSPYAVRIAHEAYAERTEFLNVQDMGKPESIISVLLPCAGKITVTVTRDGQHVDDASVTVIPKLDAGPPVLCDSVALGKYILNRAVAGSNIIGISVTDHLGESPFLHTQFITGDVPINGEVEFSKDLTTGNAAVVLKGDTSGIEAVVIHLRREKVVDELDTYRWKRDTVSVVPHLSSLPAGSGNVYIDYGEAGFDYLPITLLKGETSTLEVGHPDMLSMRYKLKTPLDLSQSRIRCVVRPASQYSALAPIALYNHPAMVGGWTLAACEIKNAGDVFELRVPRGVRLVYSVEKTWKDANLRSVMPDYATSHPIVYASHSEDSDLIVLETASNPSTSPLRDQSSLVFLIGVERDAITNVSP